MADYLPGDNEQNIVITVDPDFRKMVDELTVIAHCVKKERMKLEGILEEMRKAIIEFRDLQNG